MSDDKNNTEYEIAMQQINNLLLEHSDDTRLESKTVQDLIKWSEIIAKRPSEYSTTNMMSAIFSRLSNQLDVIFCFSTNNTLHKYVLERVLLHQSVWFAENDFHPSESYYEYLKKNIDSEISKLQTNDPKTTSPANLFFNLLKFYIEARRLAINTGSREDEERIQQDSFEHLEKSIQAINEADNPEYAEAATKFDELRHIVEPPAPKVANKR